MTRGPYDDHSRSAGAESKETSVHTPLDRSMYVYLATPWKSEAKHRSPWGTQSQCSMIGASCCNVAEMWQTRSAGCRFHPHDRSGPAKALALKPSGFTNSFLALPPLSPKAGPRFSTPWENRHFTCWSFLREVAKQCH